MTVFAYGAMNDMNGISCTGGSPMKGSSRNSIPSDIAYAGTRLNIITNARITLMILFPISFIMFNCLLL
jgi:hypothetical protein